MLSPKIGPVIVLGGLLAACGSSASTQDAAADASGTASTTCSRIEVPAHEGTDVALAGLDCEKARNVILAAVGKGRAAYAAAGFACTPTAAPEGDTDYVCTGADGARLTFHYGAA